MNKWLHKFMEKPDISDNTDKWDGNLENMPGGGPDKPDRSDPNLNLSGLSGSPWGLLEENLEINPSKGGDKSARFRFETNMSPLSLRPQGLLDEKIEKVENNHRKEGDKSDRFKMETNKSGLSGPELRENFEERLAISEYDGQQTPLQAQRIAYLDAFISLLSTLAEDDPHQDWLAQKIQTALATLEEQNFPMLN